MARTCSFVLSAFAILVAACSASNAAPQRAEPAPAPSSSNAGGDPSSSPTTNDPAPAADAGPDRASVSLVGRCGDPVPPGATEAPAFPSYAATCPALAASPNLTSITTAGSTRRFMVVTPQTIAPGEKLPLIFVWHWLGGDPGDVHDKLQMQQAVDARRFVAVIPEAKGDILFKWPFGTSQPDERLDQELQFFDDMLACVSQALPADKNCVSSIGVSAGALFTDQLASRRSQRLASFASISGGVGGVARGWTPAARKLPAMVMWGGPTDMYPTNVPLEHFDSASSDLETGLAADGHFLLECTHNCGHALPPFDPPPPGGSQLDFLWSFLLDHPYWLPQGQSLYVKSKPATMPAWCGFGKGGATPRAQSAACPQ